SRWRDDLGRRETWSETIQRFVDFMKENLQDSLTDKEYSQIHDALLHQEVVPSMRLLWASGSAARSTHVAAYNCSYIVPQKLRDFSEIMYILMCGSAAGFSVERQNIENLPRIETQSGNKRETYLVPDTKEGWCDALLSGLESWYAGDDIDFDYSAIRPKGSRLKTMGGRAMGADPLIDLLSFTKELIVSNQGRQLSSIQVHDLICKIGEIVEASGKRRAALISLSDLNDADKKKKKNGRFYETAPHRSLANNSTVYTQKPTPEEFLEE
ncbi:ribonucleoside-triphosphate reductase, partial [candidate division WWE3 bacterium]|nr:ribonucleoside-triphosphate reductase [candidate division WWE3 bacterium]